MRFAFRGPSIPTARVTSCSNFHVVKEYSSLLENSERPGFGMGRKVRAQVDKYPGKALTMLLIRNNLLTKSPGPLSNQELIAALEVALVIARSPKAPKPQRECGRRLKSANADAGAAVLFHTARYTVPWPREVQKQECQTSKPYAPKPSVLTLCPKPHLLKPKP